ncbi:MAG: glycosyl transferase group 1, partial [Frankiales bacterium]|nr:glycosyl transferase group 1 [Frankiales bacterium]
GARWLLTGRAPEEVRAAAPANVHFTGFVSTDDYLALVHAADVVLALTTRELTMQRAAYEALCAGRPLVASGTDTLREFFGDAAHYADPTAESIAGAVGAALADAAGSSSRLAEVLTVRTAEQQAALAEVRAVLDGRPA